MAGILNFQQEIRVAIRFNTTNVPGEPLQRGRQIAIDFAQLMLNRGLSHDDFIHLPADFYSNAPQILYILCDFNIRDRVQYVKNVPIEFWKVNYNLQQSPTFIKREMNGKHVTNRLPWGGRDNDWKYRLEQRGMNDKPTTSTSLSASSKSINSGQETASAGSEVSGVNSIS